MRLEEAIKRGDVVKSAEVNTWFMIAGGTFMLMVLAPPMAASLEATFRGLIAHSWQIQTDGPALAALVRNVAMAMLAALGIPLLLLCLAALAGSVIQHRFLFSVETILPQASRVSRPPVSSGCSRRRRSPTSPRVSPSSRSSAR